MNKSTLARLMVMGGGILPQVAMAASCPVPNAIANGQVADASKVMENFNAVAGCAEAGVTTTGTPATGAVAVMSGTNTITGGNLSGDITTSGGTVTTLSNSGVTPGTYTNANIVVDAKGRITSAGNGLAGGGVGAWWFHPPSSAQFTAASADATMPTISDDLDVGMVVSTPAPGPSSNDQYRLAYKSLPTSGDWQVITRITLNVAAVNYQGGGLVAYESSTGKIVGLINFNNNGRNVLSMRRGLLDAYGADINVWTIPELTTWMKMEYNSSTDTYTGYHSGDGKNWVVFSSESGSAIFSSRANRVGIAIFNSAGGGYGIPISVSAANWQQSW